MRLLSARNLKLAGKPVSTCLCKLRLRNQAGENEQAKSTAKKTNSEGLAVWGEVFELSPVLTMKAELYLRLFESHMMTADSFVGELSLALDVGANLQEKEEEAEATEEEADKEKQEVPEVLAVAAHQVVVVSDSEEAEDGLLPRPRVRLPEPLAAYLQPRAPPATTPGPPRPSKRYRLLSPQPQK